MRSCRQVERTITKGPAESAGQLMSLLPTHNLVNDLGQRIIIKVDKMLGSIPRLPSLELPELLRRVTIRRQAGRQDRHRNEGEPGSAHEAGFLRPSSRS